MLYGNFGKPLKQAKLRLKSVPTCTAMKPSVVEVE